MGLLHKISSCTSYIGEHDYALPKHLDIPGSVFFYADNYCRFEVVPVENLLTSHKDDNHIPQFAEKTFTGHGFLKCTCRDELPYPIGNMNIHKKEFKALIKCNALYYFDTVYTGSADERELNRNTRGFGFENYLLYYRFNDDDMISTCWLDYNPLSETLNTYPERLQHTLHQIGHTYGLVLIDWDDCQTVNLANKHALESYMQEDL